MLVLQREQRMLLAETLRDIANVAAGAIKEDHDHVIAELKGAAVGHLG